MKSNYYVSRLAFSGEGHYTNFDDGYALYVKRARKDIVVDKMMYKRIVKMYCKLLAERLSTDGIIDLPCGLGIISSALFTRKAQYRGNKFIGYGNYDWKKKQYDGNLKAFGLSFLPSHRVPGSIRCFGFVANRRLFKKMKEMFTSGNTNWAPIEFNNSLV